MILFPPIFFGEFVSLESCMRDMSIEVDEVSKTVDGSLVAGMIVKRPRDEDTLKILAICARVLKRNGKGSAGVEPGDLK